MEETSRPCPASQATAESSSGRPDHRPAGTPSLEHSALGKLSAMRCPFHAHGVSLSVPMTNVASGHASLDLQHGWASAKALGPEPALAWALHLAAQALAGLGTPLPHLQASPNPSSGLGEAETGRASRRKTEGVEGVKLPPEEGQEEMRFEAEREGKCRRQRKKN